MSYCDVSYEITVKIILIIYLSNVLPLQVRLTAIRIMADVMKMLLVQIHKVIYLVLATQDFPAMELIAQVRIYLSLKYYLFIHLFMFLKISAYRKIPYISPGPIFG